jgi:hypothetical protein
MGTAAGTMALLSSGAISLAEAAEPSAPARKKARVRGAFVYPPSQTLRQAGYWSWPGSSFDAEGHQTRYLARIREIEQKLGTEIRMDETPLDQESDVNRFIEDANKAPPDGLLLIPFKKGHWGHVVRIIEQTKLPTVVLATLGVLLVDHINQLHRSKGVHLICAMDDFDAVEDGIKMIRAARRMKDGLLLNIAGSKVTEATVPHLGTRVRSVPLERFYREFDETQITEAVKDLARAYGKNAAERVEPAEADITEAARATIALRRVVEAEGADAMMMNCLPGLRKPRRHVPPCMGFMSLRDEGIPAGCQSDLNATLTMMLVQALFDKPGFQQNASMETVENHFFGAHCTSASKMNGKDAPAEPYILRSHAEAGWGCVPQVLFPAGQEVTMAQYLSGESPQMFIYSGEVVRCYPKAPGGCRTNIQMTINEVSDVCDVKGMHQIIFYGNHARQLRTFCQLYGIQAVS